jgi:hypothetical protein
MEWSTSICESHIFKHFLEFLTIHTPATYLGYKDFTPTFSFWTQHLYGFPHISGSTQLVVLVVLWLILPIIVYSNFLFNDHVNSGKRVLSKMGPCDAGSITPTTAVAE